VPQLEKSLGTSLGFTKSQHVNFARFNKDFYSNLGTQKRIGALVVWKSIRTFLKGSKEAYRTEASVDKETGEVLSEEGVLSKAEWVSGELGKNRCKLSLDIRHPIYEVFIKYQAWLKGERLWDDCDRIRALLKKIEYVGQHDPSLYHEIKGARIYVDVSLSFAIYFLMLIHISCHSSLLLYHIIGGTRLSTDRDSTLLLHCKGNGSGKFGFIQMLFLHAYF